MRPYYSDGSVELWLGDCRDILPALAPVDLVLTDPPYGIALRFGGMGCKTADAARPVTGDEEPFDPAHLLTLAPCILWGANHYASRLPDAAGWLVWVKTLRPGARVLSEAELAWTNCVPKVQVFTHLWSGGYRASECGFHVHPTQKPVRLMVWALEMASKPGDIIVDPYCGSGPVLAAAKQLGRRAIGIEIEERYCEIAARRLSQEVLPFAEEPRIRELPVTRPLFAPEEAPA